MTNKKYRNYWLISVLAVVAASFYPLYMGVRVIYDMIVNGTVMKENYPKYIIPYTPIAIALIIGVLLMPLFIKAFKRYALIAGGALAIGSFFGLEFLFERKVIVATTETVAKLADWQMYLCRYVSPEEYAGESVEIIRTEKPIDILIGEYNPAFKLHFYLISVVLILAILNCIYGFAQMIKIRETGRKKALIMQSVSAVSFLGLCILACFTAFWRDGNITVSPLSAFLMSLFFIILGTTVGLFIGSLLLKQKRAITLWIPTIAATITTLVMYIGEMILLHAHLYRFGTGFLFDGIPGIVLAPIDMIVIITSGAITFLLMYVVKKKNNETVSIQ